MLQARRGPLSAFVRPLLSKTLEKGFIWVVKRKGFATNPKEEQKTRSTPKLTETAERAEPSTWCSARVCRCCVGVFSSLSHGAGAKGKGGSCRMAQENNFLPCPAACLYLRRRGSWVGALQSVYPPLSKVGTPGRYWEWVRGRLAGTTADPMESSARVTCPQGEVGVAFPQWLPQSFTILH